MRKMSKSAVQVAREALAAGRAALPEFGSRTSRKDYTQPQLFALLVLRQFLRTDYRGVVVKVGKRARLPTIRDLDAATLQLRQAGGVLMYDTVADGAVREAAFAVVPRAAFAAALEQIDAIVWPPGDLYFTELRAQAGKLRFLPALLRVNAGRISLIRGVRPWR